MDRSSQCTRYPVDWMRAEIFPYPSIYQLKALENLVESGANCFPAVMANFSSQDEIKKLRQRLREISPDFAEFEKEELILYPFVVEHLEKAGLKQF